MKSLPRTAALLIVTLEKGAGESEGGRRGGAEAKAARLLAAWRASGRPVVHVRHPPQEPGPPRRAGREVEDALAPEAGEVVIQDWGQGAFADTGLEPLLKDRGIEALVVAGLIVDESLEATVRDAGALGYATYLAADAIAALGRVDLAGRRWSAEDVQALALAKLEHEKATLTDTATILAAL
jgi:nicotinamidase-related amidase